MTIKLKTVLLTLSLATLFQFSPAFAQIGSSELISADLCSGEGATHIDADGARQACHTGTWQPIFNVRATIYRGGAVVAEEKGEVQDRHEFVTTGTSKDDKDTTYRMSLTPAYTTNGRIEVRVNMKLSTVVHRHVLRSGNASLPVADYEVCSVTEMPSAPLNEPVVVLNVSNLQAPEELEQVIGGHHGCSIKLEVSRTVTAAPTAPNH